MDYAINSLSSQLKDHCSLNISYTDNFFSKIEDLKASSDWKYILLMGEEALLDKKHLLHQRLELHLELSKCCEPLAEPNLGMEHAKKAFEMASYVDDHNKCMESLTLMSMHERNQSYHVSGSKEKEEAFKKAKSSAFKAIGFLESSNNTKIQAETFYQGALTCSESPTPDFGVAMCWFRESMKRFSQINDLEGYYKTTIGTAYLSLQMDKETTCKHFIDAIPFDDLSASNKVLFYHLLTRYYIATQKEDKAKESLNSAIALAQLLEREDFSFLLKNCSEALKEKPIYAIEHFAQKV